MNITQARRLRNGQLNGQSDISKIKVKRLDDNTIIIINGKPDGLLGIISSNSEKISSDILSAIINQLICQLIL